MHVTPHALDHRYLGAIQWWGGTIAYNSAIRPRWSSNDIQCYLTVEGFVRCAFPSAVSRVLCQTDPPAPANHKSAIADVSVNPSMWMNSSSFTTCPQGHWTLKAFACDFDSKCWTGASKIRFQCDPPSDLSPLPPSFTCDSGVEHVAYTLVCDYRRDCTDESDEDFCHFLPCDETHQFSCGNGQVVEFSL